MLRMSACLGLLLSVVCWSAQAADKAYFYTGGSTKNLPADAGVDLWSIDLESGAMVREANPAPVTNPGYLTTNADGSRVYATNSVPGEEGGFISTFKVDARTQRLTKLQTQKTDASPASYIRLDGTGKYMLSANYGRGNIVVNPVNADGTLGETTANIKHEGSSVHQRRQQGSHAHCIVASPDNDFVFVPDLGIDKIVAYRFDDSTGALTAAPELDVVTPPGSGPRHILFHPNGKLAFATIEMSGHLGAYTSADGKLTPVGLYAATPPSYVGAQSTSEVRISADGRFVYIGNRGHDSIAVFKIDQKTGEVELIQNQSSGGSWPRNFGITPDGSMMVVGNQKSDSIVSFRINSRTGKLSPTGEEAFSSGPSYVLFK